MVTVIWPDEVTWRLPLDIARKRLGKLYELTGANYLLKFNDGDTVVIGRFMLSKI